MSGVKIKKPYEASSGDLGVDCSKDKKLTEQAHTDACDLNVIMKRYGASGVFPVGLERGPGLYGDFSGLVDYQEQLNRVNYARETFAALPAEVRARFENDPAKLIEFVSRPENRAEGEILGIFTKRDQPSQDGVSAPQEAPPSKSSPSVGKSEAPASGASDSGVKN